MEKEWVDQEFVLLIIAALPSEAGLPNWVNILLDTEIEEACWFVDCKCESVRQTSQKQPIDTLEVSIKDSLCQF